MKIGVIELYLTTVTFYFSQQKKRKSTIQSAPTEPTEYYNLTSILYLYSF